MTATAEVVEKVMAKVEEFYMGEDENSGEQIFNNWAANWASKFEDIQAMDQVEHKLEYTQAFEEYQKLFESHIERII